MDGAVSARELHEFLEVSTRFNDWVTRRIEEFGFIQGQDFEVYSTLSIAKKYLLSLDMAKELALSPRKGPAPWSSPGSP